MDFIHFGLLRDFYLFHGYPGLGLLLGEGYRKHTVSKRCFNGIGINDLGEFECLVEAG
jgi:hypothetical protein